MPVSLQIAKEPVRVESAFDAEGNLHRRRDFLQVYERTPGKLIENQMFEIPKQKAEQDAGKIYKTASEREDYIERKGNVIGVVGNPGIGKTTLMKKWVKQVLHRELLPNVSFLFYILIRNIDYSTKVTLFHFLLSTIMPRANHSPEFDKYWMERIVGDRDVLIALDGLDEARVDNFAVRAPTVNIQSLADPFHLILNLISGKLLPFARVVVTSRPNQLFRLHSDHKPGFIVQILGLDQKGQDDLGEQIALDYYKTIRPTLVKNPDAFAYCHVPINFILTVDYLMSTSRDIKFLCMTQVLAAACESYSCSDHVRSVADDCQLDKLSRLAFTGFTKSQIFFTESDFQRAKIDEKVVQSFLDTSITKKAKIKSKILNGHKRNYFSHLIWQEFFAAMYLMLFGSEEEYEKSLENVSDDRWEVVSKFLFGLTNKEVFDNLKDITPDSKTGLWPRKKEKLKSVACSHLQRLSLQDQTPADKSKMVDFEKLLKSCGWVQEANDLEFTRSFASNLPGNIAFSTTVLPSDIANFFYIVRLAAELPDLHVDRCNFAGDALMMFCKEVAAMPGIKVIKSSGCASRS